MNAEKAREFFSAYYEGVLERGLNEQFERALRGDAQVQAEYRAFEQAMQSLESLKAPVPEPDFDLHETIARRLDKHQYDEKRRAVSPLIGWWKSLALGGLATAALLATVFQLKNQSDVGMAGALGGSQSEQLQLTSDASGFQMRYFASQPTEIAIKSADGNVLAQDRKNGGRMTFQLTNPNAQAVLLEVDVEGDSEQIFVALPGSRMQSAQAGEGGIKDLSLALAGFYRVPILLKLGADVELKWTFGPGDPHDAAESALKGTKYSALKNPDGVLGIQPN